MTQTKKALLMSGFSMLLCVAMLVSMTFAWFTDSASTGINKIQAGNLDVQLLMKDENGVYNDISDRKDVIFGTGSIAQNNNQQTLWEPGKTQVAYLAVRNAGALALKYNIVLNIEDEGLASALQYVIVPQGKQMGKDQTVPNEVTESEWDEISKNAQPLPTGTVIAAENGCLDEIAKDPNNVNETEYFALAIHMKDDAADTYQDKKVNIDISVIATQAAGESDSFDDSYDEKAVYPAITVATATELSNAIKAANADNTIKLTADISTTSVLSVNKKITLDLNGKSLTGSAAQTLKLNKGADLTIQDSNADGTGKIGNTYSGSADSTTIDLQGADAKLTILSGTIEGNSKDDLYTVVIGNSKNQTCTVDIKGGTVAVYEGHVKSRAITASKGMMLSISDGTIHGGLYGIDIYDGANVIITGGTATANDKVSRDDEYGKEYAIHMKGTGTLTVGSEDVDTTPTLQGIKFEANGPKTSLPTINLVKGKITSPIYSLETKYNYKLFKLGIAANAPVTFVDDTAQYFLPDGLQMTQNGDIWTVTAK